MFITVAVASASVLGNECDSRVTKSLSMREEWRATTKRGIATTERGIESLASQSVTGMPYERVSDCYGGSVREGYE